jgi:hypothetical protein
MKDLAPANHTGGLNVRVLQCMGGATDRIPFWFEPVSVFGSFTFTAPYGSSLMLDMSFSLTLKPH